MVTSSATSDDAGAGGAAVTAAGGATAGTFETVAALGGVTETDAAGVLGAGAGTAVTEKVD
jgi:hypothetical protein